MRPGTRLILDRVRKSKADPIKSEQWLDLVDDVLSMGRDNFLRAVSTTSPTKAKAKAPCDKPDRLAQRIERYRKKSGLSTRDFVRELYARISTQLPKPPASAFTSLSKFLTFARRSMNDADLEMACANVTDTYA